MPPSGGPWARPRWACSSVVEHCVDIAGVASSILATPTIFLSHHPVSDFPEPAFMADEEIRMFADSVGRFLARNAPPERVAKWRADGMVEREFWRDAGQAGLLGVS